LSQLFASNFSPVPTVLKQFFTRNALCDVDLHFSLMLLRIAIAVEEKINDLRDYITDVISLYT